MSAPAWSPDGRLIAWEELVAGAGNVIWVGNADGSNPHRVSPPVDALGELQWLSNRELIYWANFQVYRLPLGGHSSLVSPVIGFDFGLNRPQRLIASGSPGCPSCNAPIVVINTRNGTSIRIGGNDSDSYPTFSPDGSKVAFARDACPIKGDECNVGLGIWIVPASGGTSEQLTSSGTCPRWSPDGREIFYSTTAGFLIPPSGGISRKILDTAGSYCDARWSPDSRYIATTTRDVQLAVVGVRSSTLTSYNGLGQVIGFTWSPDSRHLLVAVRPSPRACSSLWLVTTHGLAHELRPCF